MVSLAVLLRRTLAYEPLDRHYLNFLTVKAVAAPNGHYVSALQLQADHDTLPQNNTAGAYVIVYWALRAAALNRHNTFAR